MSELLKLAERCESATGPDREMFEDIWREVFPKPERIWVTDNAGDWTPEYAAWQERQHRFYDLLDAGAFLDAAMRLVPEGWNWMAGNRDQPIARAYVNNGQLQFVGIGTRRNTESRWFEVVAATPALALCAAALRARQSLLPQENSR